MEQSMSKQELDDLAKIIDCLNYENKEIITPAILHDELWYGLNKLKHSQNQDALLEGWKYKTAFITTERCHQNNVSHFKLIHLWEQSFVLYFWMCIYH
jgi:hypothetical protein